MNLIKTNQTTAGLVTGGVILAIHLLQTSVFGFQSTSDQIPSVNAKPQLTVSLASGSNSNHSDADDSDPNPAEQNQLLNLRIDSNRATQIEFPVQFPEQTSGHSTATERQIPQAHGSFGGASRKTTDQPFQNPGDQRTIPPENSLRKKSGATTQPGNPNPSVAANVQATYTAPLTEEQIMIRLSPEKLVGVTTGPTDSLSTSKSPSNSSTIPGDENHSEIDAVDYEDLNFGPPSPVNSATEMHSIPNRKKAHRLQNSSTTFLGRPTPTSRQRQNKIQRTKQRWIPTRTIQLKIRMTTLVVRSMPRMSGQRKRKKKNLLNSTMEKVAWSTAGVLIIAVGSILILKKTGIRFQSGRITKNALPVIQTTTLGNKCQLQLVEMNDYTILVGTDSTGIKSVIQLPKSFKEELVRAEEDAVT